MHQSVIHQTIWHCYSNHATEIVIQVQKLVKVIMSVGQVTFLTHLPYRRSRQRKNFTPLSWNISFHPIPLSPDFYNEPEEEVC